MAGANDIARADDADSQFWLFLCIGLRAIICWATGWLMQLNLTAGAMARSTSKFIGGPVDPTARGVEVNRLLMADEQRFA
jgi:hypothetical protein